MKIIILLICLTTLHLNSAAQNISYDIPQGYEQEISKEAYKKMIDIAVPIVATRFAIDYVKNGTIQLKKDQVMQMFNLHNLITQYSSVKDKSLLGRVVQDHFDKIFTSIDEEAKIDPENYETVKNYLSLRIYPEDMVRQRGGVGSLISKTDLEGTYTLLMLDLPGAFKPVSKQMFALWKRDTTEIFKVAQANINKQKVEKVTKSFDVDGAKIEINFIGNEDYAASYALDLMGNSPELVGEWGSVVVMPNKGLVNICLISKGKPVDFVKFIQYVKPTIGDAYQQHAQPISDQFYWYYKGRFTKINIVTTPNGGINVIAPFGLTELMTEKK